MNNNPDFDLQRKSSAVTLSDMEVFVFPELIYSLLLANIMSPRIWQWRADPWFKGVERMKPVRRMQRLKQFIMDHYAFNLDLNTWGLTTKAAELARFRDFIDAETLRQSNALFGYEGDKYYFDIDIRAHFGLDQYEGDVIPYWKTETVEAMDAFQYRPGFQTGAGECVSLAALYAAAVFVICRIPLSDIFMMATPLHSQNFVDVADGILTNNRRLVTRNMWFNGTALSAQARRALENERVTIVAHESGYAHVIYDAATIDAAAYERFAGRLSDYLRTDLNVEIMGNFLRHQHDFQKCFQLRWPVHGRDHFIRLDRVFAYEQDTPARLTDNTRPRLLAEIDMEEFHPQPLSGCIILNDLEDFVGKRRFDFKKSEDVELLRRRFASDCLNAAVAIESLIKFCNVRPRLPDISAGNSARAPAAAPPGLRPDMSREECIRRLETVREDNPTVDLAFYAYRDLNRVDDLPFLLAAMERNPVAPAATEKMPEHEILARLEAMPDKSIYDEPGRLAQPDEVWNFGRGAGVEKALLLAACLHRRDPDRPLELEITADTARLLSDDQSWSFNGVSGLAPRHRQLNIPSCDGTSIFV